MGTDQPPPPGEVVIVPARPTPREARARDSRTDDADIVEVWGRDSFPASDPPANW